MARMLCLDARRMGIRTVVWSGTLTAEPTDGVADIVIKRSFDDKSARTQFCRQVDVVTVEFENIPVETLRLVEEKVALYPSSASIEITQHRSREKTFLQIHGIPCTPFAFIDSLTGLKQAYAELGPRCVLKTAAFGYDGKGQVNLTAVDQLHDAWVAVEKLPSVLETFIDFQCEISVLVARGHDGECRAFPSAENKHRHHMLDLSIVPARVSEKTLAEAQAIALDLIAKLDYRGLLSVEFFVEKSGGVIVNELAPRPHNSGHYTMDACVTSQFEQQLRAVCGFPLGSTELLSPSVMLNLLGDMWHPDLDKAPIMAAEGAKFHRYGKSSPGVRRKMGHVNFVGQGDLLARAEGLKATLLGL